MLGDFGDPCTRCGAASTNHDPRDRLCDCAACPTCGKPTGWLCAYCGGSLGCSEHRLTIEAHCETTCPVPSTDRPAIEAALKRKAETA